MLNAYKGNCFNYAECITCESWDCCWCYWNFMMMQNSDAWSCVYPIEKLRNWNLKLASEMLLQNPPFSLLTNIALVLHREVCMTYIFLWVSYLQLQLRQCTSRPTHLSKSPQCPLNYPFFLHLSDHFESCLVLSTSCIDQEHLLFRPLGEYLNRESKASFLPAVKESW